MSPDLRYERVYRQLCKVYDTPFHIQKDDNYVRMSNKRHSKESIDYHDYSTTADKNIAWRYMHLTTGDKTWHILYFCYYTYLNVLSGLFVNQSRDILTLTARGSTLDVKI